MAQSIPWTQPLKSFLTTTPTIFSRAQGSSSSQQGAYSAVPDAQYPLHDTSDDPRQGNFSPLPSAQYEQPTTYPPSYESKPYQAPARLRKSFKRLRRSIKILTLISAAVSAILSGLILGAMVYVVYTYYDTQNRASAPGYDFRQGPWADHTKIWPTYLLLGLSGVTCLVSLITFITTCCKARRKVSFSMIYHCVHFLAWGAVVTVYRLAKRGDDLWGWSCSSEARGVQGAYKGIVKFDVLCKVQTIAWELSIAEAGIKLIWFVFGWHLNRRQRKLTGEIVREFGNAAWDELDFDL